MASPSRQYISAHTDPGSPRTTIYLCCVLSLTVYISHCLTVVREKLPVLYEFKLIPCGWVVPCTGTSKREGEQLRGRETIFRSASDAVKVNAIRSIPRRGRHSVHPIGAGLKSAVRVQRGPRHGALFRVLRAFVAAQRCRRVVAGDTLAVGLGPRGNREVQQQEDNGRQRKRGTPPRRQHDSQVSPHAQGVIRFYEDERERDL